MTSDRIIKELDKQDEITGVTPNTILLRRFLSRITKASQWIAMVNTVRHRYGSMSYQSYRFYYPTPELILVMELEYLDIKDKNRIKSIT